MDYSPCGRKESDTTELTNTFSSFLNLDDKIDI